MGELQSLVLMTVRDHPFIDAHQLARFLALPLEHVVPVLFECFEKGFLESLRLRSLVGWGERDLYALSDKGMDELARLEGISPERYWALYPEVDRVFYQRALLKIDTLYTVRQLLALWAREWELAFWTTPTRVRFIYRGESQWMVLQGWGWIRRPAPGGGWVPVCIEWDQGDVPVKGFRQRFGAFYRWSESQEARAHPEAFPVLVMVTSTRRRAMETLYYLREASVRWQLPWLACFVTSQREAFKTDGVWYRLGAEGSPGPLLVGQKGLPEPLAEQGGLVSQMTTGSRRKRSLGASLSELISEGHGAHKVSRSHTEHLVKVRLLLSRIEWGVLRTVAGWPFLNFTEVATVLRVLFSEGDAAPEDIGRDLGRLQDLGLVNSVVSETGASYWYVSGLGIELLAAGSHLALRRYARERGWWVPKGGQEITLLIGEYIQAWEHTRAIISFMLSFVRLMEYKQGANIDHELVEWDFTPRFFWKHGAGDLSLFPDSVASYRVGNQVYTFFLEVDRQKGHRERLLERMIKYAQYYSSGAYRATFGKFPTLVVVAGDEGRLREICDEVKGACRLAGSGLLPLRVTTMLLLKEKGVTGCIWRRADGERLQHLFPAFAGEPRSAIQPLVIR